jgi:phage repressor protein C with HTH and peptisase S24 domain
MSEIIFDSVKQRLISFLKHEKISQRAFEISVDLSNGYVNNINKSIQPDKVQRITLRYPNLNTGWLLTGDGEMLKESKINEQTDQIPLLPISAQGGSLNDFIVSVKDTDCERIISPIKGADFAVTVAGESMYPEYPSGSQVLVKKINEKAFIDWGKVYVLDTVNGSVIKRIVPSDKEGCIQCISINTDPIYASFDVLQTDVFGMYRVMLCMSIK